MSPGSVRNALIAAAALLVLLPASASAWTVTIHVHGAGGVLETTNRLGGNQNQMNCLVEPGGKSNNSVTDCVGGTASGLYNSGNIVRLIPQASATATGRGWRFDHWTDSSAGGGLINCDPQETSGDFTSPNYCEFQIFENLRADLWFKDTIGPPDTAINGGPAQGSTTSSTTASFTSFTANSDPDATFQCRLDPPGSIGAFGACPKNGATFSNLTQNGTWQLNVRAADPSGNVDTNPAVRNWVVDTTPPAVHITSGPTEGSRTNATSADLGVSTSDGTLVCTLDSATLPSCSPPSVHLSGLNDGTHTFSVRGIDAVGNSSAPITRSWTVDATPPAVAINGGPTGPTNATSAMFTVTTSDGTVACQLDGNDAPCAGPHSGLADGAHTFTATATDVATNQTTAVRHWTVDTVAPDVSLLSGPAAGSTTITSSASFTFKSTDSAATFQCKLDLGPFAACASPLTISGVPNGDHTFSVRAVDAAGNSSSVASRNWAVNDRDRDHDGIDTPADCNDTNAAIHPGAADVPDDGIDQDCSGADAHNSDQDADGVIEGQDCNDHDASIHPGAVDIPGDGIDQNCDGKDATVALVPGGIRYKFSTLGAKTTMVILKLKDLTAPRTTVTVTCKGKGCKFRSRKAKPSKSHALDVRKLLGHKPLKAGQTLTIRIGAPGYRSKAARFTMRRGKLPKGGAFGAI